MCWLANELGLFSVLFGTRQIFQSATLSSTVQVPATLFSTHLTLYPLGATLVSERPRRPRLLENKIYYLTPRFKTRYWDNVSPPTPNLTPKDNTIL
jgi:hypothetical protein